MNRHLERGLATGDAQHDFAERTVESENQGVRIDAFPSLKATAYVVWYKFYADRGRNWTRSDAFDIVIASAAPYVDAIVTESHLTEGLRKMKRLDDFIGHLTIHTLRDFRHSAPSAARSTGRGAATADPGTQASSL
jgi:hypothetical protein